MLYRSGSAVQQSKWVRQPPLVVTRVQLTVVQHCVVMLCPILFTFGGRYFQDTVEDLYLQVSLQAAGNVANETDVVTSAEGGSRYEAIGKRFGFELRFPSSRQPLVDLGHSLQEAGLTPSAVLVLQRTL